MNATTSESRAASAQASADLNMSAANGVLTISFAGDWVLGRTLPSGPEAVARAEAQGAVRRVVLAGQQMGQWDTAFLLVVNALSRWCKYRNLDLDAQALPDGAAGLLQLASAVPERTGARREDPREPFLARLGKRSVKSWQENANSLEFLGEATLSFGRLLTGRARYRKADLWLTVEQCGPQALGIVTTISTLVGAILAFVGAIQLKMFGAEVYVANLVGLGMVIEMGALMTGIILAGRTGAAFAAQLGTMQVNEEIDALKTLGIPPMDYLVLPRMLALAVMTPLLVIYADVLGILGGAIVGVFVLNIPPVLFFHQTFDTMSLWFCAQGLIKGSTFGVLIALAGCLRGMQCGRSASAVGQAATSAVVTSIVLIVLSDAVWTFLFMIFQ
jgi:phospholipid/cholesterol/gamma-HCH transport system permease protein